MTMDENELNIFREKLEAEFDSLLAKGEDVKSFLYLPYNFLTPKIKKYLDDLLMDEAYIALSNDKFDVKAFKVYEDSLLSVNLETKEQKVELLERMIAHYTEKEEYEKCSKIQSILKKINQ